MTNMGRFVIYGLFDPRGAGELRYVGKSSSGLYRPRRHEHASDLRACANTHKARWIEELHREGVHPEIVVLEEAANLESLSELERVAIAHYRAMGFRLTNALDGGGLSGFKHSAASRRKMSAAASGKAKSAAHRAALSVAMSGRALPAATREKIRAALKLHAAQPEARERLATLRLGRKNSDAARDALRQANLGLKHSPERRAANAGARLGKPLSDETRRRMSEAQRCAWERRRL